MRCAPLAAIILLILPASPAARAQTASLPAAATRVRVTSPTVSDGRLVGWGQHVPERECAAISNAAFSNQALTADLARHRHQPPVPG